MDRFWSYFLIEFVGLNFRRTFGFSDFFSFRTDFGIIGSGIVSYTRAGFLRCRGERSGLAFWTDSGNCLSNSWAGSLVHVVFVGHFFVFQMV